VGCVALPGDNNFYGFCYQELNSSQSELTNLYQTTNLFFGILVVLSHRLLFQLANDSHQRSWQFKLDYLPTLWATHHIAVRQKNALGRAMRRLPTDAIFMSNCRARYPIDEYGFGHVNYALA